LVTAGVEAASGCPGGRVKGCDEARNSSKGDASVVGNTGVRDGCVSGVSGTVVVAGDKGGGNCSDGDRRCVSFLKWRR